VRYVLDACALLAFLNQEDGWEKVRRLLDEAARVKAFYKHVSLADAMGLATAFCTGGIFVTSDHHELDIVNAREAVRFLWIR
jgi:predicted nucleic acid-binding protein